MKISNPISGYFESGRKLKAEEAALNEQQRRNAGTAKALGMNESSRYLSGTMRAPQEKMLSATETKKTGAAESYAKRAGISEDQKKAQLADIQIDRKIMESAMNENTWHKAVQSLGYSMQESAKLIARYRQEQRENREAYSKLMQTIAIVGVSAYTGGMGGAAITMAGSEAIKGSEGG